jgi:hypothetical protein
MGGCCARWPLDPLRRAPGGFCISFTACEPVDQQNSRSKGVQIRSGNRGTG